MRSWLHRVSDVHVLFCVLKHHRWFAPPVFVMFGGFKGTYSKPSYTPWALTTKAPQKWWHIFSLALAVSFRQYTFQERYQVTRWKSPWVQWFSKLVEFPLFETCMLGKMSSSNQWFDGSLMNKDLWKMQGLHAYDKVLISKYPKMQWIKPNGRYKTLEATTYPRREDVGNLGDPSNSFVNIPHHCPQHKPYIVGTWWYT